MSKWLTYLEISALVIVASLGITLISIAQIAEKKASVIETIVLDDNHMVLLRGEVNDSSVREAGKELLMKSKFVPNTDRLYLVLDTPGGHLDSGSRLIAIAKGLPQKVDTIILEASSMGFNIAQALGERLITRYGQMFQHVGYMGMPAGRPDTVKSYVLFVERQFQILHLTSARRMGLSLSAFMLLIQKDYWVQGQDAVDQKAADRVVDIRCADSMPFEQCPLLPEAKTTIPFQVGP
jgi:ATP-dependent protease ClpP protease subunit